MDAIAALVLGTLLLVIGPAYMLGGPAAAKKAISLMFKYIVRWPIAQCLRLAAHLLSSGAGLVLPAPKKKKKRRP